MPRPDVPASTARNQGPFDAIHGDMLRHFQDLVLAMGGDADALFQQVGISSGHAPQGRQRASYRQFVSLLELAAAELDCPDFGMQLALRQSKTAFVGPLGDGMRNSRSFGEALRFVCSHSYAHSLAAWIWLRPSLSGESTVVGHDILLEGQPHKAQAMEYILLVGNLATLDLTQGRVRARRVLFRHQPISTVKSYRRQFGCEVRFGRSADAVIYDNHDLACPISEPDAQAWQQAATKLETRFVERKPPLYADVRGVISHLLGAEACDREHVSAALGLHPRTMLRRLADEGTSFQRIKDEVRRDRMLYYLHQTGLDFTAISERLGFAEQAVMTRSCRKWFGASPSALRQASRSIASTA
jgi:AraC-like DNA-binding protein